jgi:pyruvate kinase
MRPEQPTVSVTRRTKIVATLGPASEAPDVLERMLAAGADVVRFNFSHGTPDEHAARLEAVRRLSASRGWTVAALQDLPGPKLRIGALPGGSLILTAGDAVVLSTDGATGPGVIPVAYSHLADDVRPGDRLVVRSVAPARVQCAVESGGPVRQHAGLNLPGVQLSVPAVTDDDLRALEWGLTHQVDFVGLSFVEAAADIERVRQILAARRVPCQLVAKIERRRALDRIEEIVAASDAVMVARGDLAVETSIDEVPLVQKSIIALCNRLGKAVITATQMLESMMTHPRPTRAEAADVANAVFDGTDALMLSGETAIGAHPVEAVATMETIAHRAEGALPYDLILRERGREHTTETGEAIALAACQAAEAIGAAAIVAATDSGSTARRVSRLRPRRPIVAVTHTPATARQLSLTWGVCPVLVEQVSDLDTLVARGVRAARDLGVARHGDQVVVTAGLPIGQPGTTNFLKVIRVE